MVQLRHHHVWRVSLDDSLEHFMLDHYFGKSPEFFISFLDQGRFDFALLFLSAINHLLNPGADLSDGVHARMRRRRHHPGVAAFKSDVVVLPALLIGLAEQLGCEPDIVSKEDNLVAIGKSNNAVADLMDTSIVHACYRIVKDHGRGRRDGRDLGKKVSQRKRFLFTLRQNLTRFVRSDQLPPRHLSLPAGEVQRHDRGAQRLALVFKASPEILIKKFLACFLGGFSQGSKNTGQVVFDNCRPSDPLGIRYPLLDLRQEIADIASPEILGHEFGDSSSVVPCTRYDANEVTRNPVA